MVRPEGSEKSVLRSELLALGKLMVGLGGAGGTATSGLVMVSAGCHDLDGVTADSGETDPGAAGVWAFLRGLRPELGGLSCSSVDLEAGAVVDRDDILRAVELATEHITEPELAVGADGDVLCRRLIKHPTGLAGAMPVEEGKAVQAVVSSGIKDGGGYIVTGGLGGLGLQAAEQLVDGGAGSVVLFSRSGAVPWSAWPVWERLLATGTASKLSVVRCDVADGRSVCRAVDAARQICGGSITGVLHVAGLLADSTVRAMTDEQFDTVCGPKIEGGWSMHHATLVDGIDQFVSYSSVSALRGTLGQSNYCFANGWLDGMCGLRRAGGLRCASVQWGPWSDVGMAAAADGLLDGMAAEGYIAVEPAVGKKGLLYF